MSYDPSDEKQVRCRQQAAKNKQRTHDDDMRRLLAEPWGRRIAWRMLTFCRIYEDSYTGDYTTFYNEGRRSAGLKLLRDITVADPEAYSTMIQENQEDNHART